MCWCVWLLYAVLRDAQTFHHLLYTLEVYIYITHHHLTGISMLGRSLLVCLNMGQLESGATGEMFDDIRESGVSITE